MSEDNGVWLGLLKWSLAYSDGTRPSNESMQPMSEEDKKFLESVMKDGIIDEGKRMKAILAELTLTLEPILGEKDSAASNSESKSIPTLLPEDEMIELLLELRDIVEQIDYARAFMSMGGISFLLGCANERALIPATIREKSLVVLATVTQNNPPAQNKLLVSDNGLHYLCKLFFEESQDLRNDVDGKMRSRILQAISCAIRGHAVGEETFCTNPQLRSILDLGLGVVAMVPSGTGSNFSDEELRERIPPLRLRTKSLFFLRALLTSDTSSPERIQYFSNSLKKIIDNTVDISNEDLDLKELSLGLLVSILRQKKSVNLILDELDRIVAKGVSRVAELRALPEGEEKEIAATEMELWESLIVELSRSERDVQNPESSAPTIMMISDSPANIPAESLPQ